MSVKLETLPRDTPPRELVSLIERDGAVIVENFVSPANLARLNRDLETVVQSTTAGDPAGDPTSQAFHGERTKRFTRLSMHSCVFVELMIDPLMLTYADHFLLASCSDYWLNTGQVMVIGPGEPAQIVHLDDDIWPELEWPKNLSVGSMIALSDFTADNGATVVAPGSHQWSKKRKPKPEETTQAVMPAGSIVMYLGKTIHGAGANVSNTWRRGMHIGFTLGWLRPEENHQLAIPLETAKTLPRRAQELLGFRAYFPHDGNYLGMVDYQDPEFLLKE